MKAIIENCKKILCRIATPEASGSAFYISKYNVIVTSEHIIRGHKNIIVDNEYFEKCQVKVIYTDQLLDLALLRSDHSLELPECNISSEIELGMHLVSLAYPFRKGLVMKEGKIELLSEIYHGASHFVHNALIDNSANGGPIFDENGNILGMNNIVRTKDGRKGYALPAKSILNSIKAYTDSKATIASRCPNCKNIVGGEKIDNCPKCGHYIEMPDNVEEFHPTGVSKTVEELLLSMGFNLELSRIGPEHWELTRGSALVDITYHQKNGLIIGDAYMCKIPPQNNGPLYEYLLRLNQKLENLTFSVRGDDIILSLLIYDRYLNEETGTKLLTNLLETADHYDNILVKEYGCLWTSLRKLI